MKRKINLRPGLLLGGAIALGLSLSATAENLVETLADRPEFSTLVTAVTEAGLADTLASAEDITILAPTNEAFAAIPEDALAALLADKDALTSVLTYHVIPERISFRDFESGPLETLLPENSVDVEVKSFFWRWYRTVRIDEAVITRSNLRADNGVIHAINQVLDPDFQQVPSLLEIAASNPDFSILASL
ncbi:MAG: fasciclin domain-containing protein, partial [Verrucomicrobiota bacterium]|nr:fasciclin domain-containing protein [Verrucomicrobiota bacterium]